MIPKHPTIKDAKEMSQRYNADGIIQLIFFGGDVMSVSYGRTKRLCKGYGIIADEIINILETGEIEVPR